jgi:hypothetical protein
MNDLNLEQLGQHFVKRVTALAEEMRLKNIVNTHCEYEVFSDLEYVPIDPLSPPNFEE